jgi:hypothetical protein
LNKKILEKYIIPEYQTIDYILERDPKMGEMLSDYKGEIHLLKCAEAHIIFNDEFQVIGYIPETSRYFFERILEDGKLSEEKLKYGADYIFWIIIQREI